MGIISFLSARPSHRGRRVLGQRGAIGVAFAIGSTALLGMGALATEAGIWLAVRRNAQDAADAAAYAGIVRLNLTDANAATTAATQVATRNGFTDSGSLSAAGDNRVRVQTGFWQNNTFTSPAPSGSSANAVRVDIWQVQRIGLAQLISRTAPIAWGGAVAVLEIGGPACTLSIPPPTTTSQVMGRTNIAGSTTVNAPNCIIASNMEGSKSINVQGAAVNSLTAAALRASGQCYNCEDVPSGNLPGGYVSGAATTDNPYKYLDAWAMPTFGSGAGNSPCVDPLYLNATGGVVQNQNQAATIYLAAYNPGRSDVVNYTQNGNARTYGVSQSTYAATCTNISLSGQTLVLKPGTYFFNNASLAMSNGTITCDGCSAGGAGVTLVFTGSNSNNVGNIQITGGNFTLIAPGTDALASPSIFRGTAIYRDDLAAVSNSANDTMIITGNSTSTLFGAIYSPTAEVRMVGTSGMNQTVAGNCIAVVAAEITFSGNSGAQIDACESNGTTVARVRYVRFVL
ncbi:pilus assembly protein TadG-related protein [Neoroseomonas soli]|uniref:Putative Flp pilus-assembly TadG-like N-terminal domain-containing protein n=1 Tax=Neoroseomonas soli TaxID=1081025 RepID=A0A9X9X0S7_9PROT|nr:pilus assembly protein TadG-related protein [Neoroseomonas soli]MBR0673006.1 hypothetical protein [Neoroseomonas soli]